MRRFLPAMVALTLVVAACGGGDSDDEAEVTETSVEESTTTTAAALDVADDAEATSTTTTVVPAGPTAPLTGEEVAAAPSTPALAVKIDNHPNARANHTGLVEADWLFEEVVEASLTRFVAVFQSEVPEVVGPVRSARSTDVVLLANLNGALFVNSGGNNGVMSQARNSPHLTNLSDGAVAGAFFRGAGSAPHNLYVNTAPLLEVADESNGVPESAFVYRYDGDAPATAEPTTRIDIDYGGTQVAYSWDEAAGVFVREQNGEPHLDADDQPVVAANVIVLETPYGTSSADPRSPEALVVGSGDAWVLNEGSLVRGTWSRDSETASLVLTDSAGAPVTLVPGPSYIGLPRPGQVSAG